MKQVQGWLLDLMDEGFDKTAWHGPSLLSAVRGLTAEQAAWRPAPGRNSVWQIVLHCAYWKHRVHQRVAPATAEPFPRDGKDWPEPPSEVSVAAWKADVDLLKSTHAALRSAVAGLRPSELGRPGPGQKRTRMENLMGIACHDLYHAGQIRLVTRLLEDVHAGPAAGRRRAADDTHLTLEASV